MEELTINQIKAKLASGELTIRQLAESYLERINTLDKAGPKINSVLELNPDALEIADKLDLELKQGKTKGALHGIPVLIKDNIDTNDRMTTTAFRCAPGHSTARCWCHHPWQNQPVGMGKLPLYPFCERLVKPWRTG